MTNQIGFFHSVVDGSHGSSGKGAVSTRLVDILGVRNASSCNYDNAGHTSIVDGVKFVAHALPTSAILKKVRGYPLKLWIGPNSGLVMSRLEKEMAETGYFDGDNDFNVHARAGITEQRHVDMESPGGVWSTEWLSSTMSGSGATFADKAMRSQQFKSAQDILKRTLQPMDFMRAVRNEMDCGKSFIHEVSQGFALSLDYGTTWKQSTFRNCTAQQAYADMCITPEYVGDVYLNLRSLPIRVGSNFRDGKQTGYAGDFMPDQTELTWEQVAEMAEMPTGEAAKLRAREFTTCTHKLRRVATFSDQLLRDAAESCGATKLVLNFPQYIHYSALDVRGGHAAFNTLHPKVRAFVDHLEDVANLPVVMVCTGASHDSFIWRG